MPARRTSKTLVAVALLGLLCAPLALASTAAPEGEHGGGGGESSLFAGDLGNAAWTLVIFLIVVFVLGKFAWGPLLSTLQDRESFIRDSLASAKKDREEAQARLEEYTTKLAEARAEASGIVSEGRRDAEVVKAKIEQDARDEAGKMIERAKREIEVAKATAIRELYQTSATLATEVAAQVIKREVKPEDHERLIQDAIEQLGSRDLN